MESRRKLDVARTAASHAIGGRALTLFILVASLLSASPPSHYDVDVQRGSEAFREKRYAEAAAHMRRALRERPGDPYANEFLGTIYFLHGNLEAALQYWNRLGNRPQIAEIHLPPDLRIDPVLLDRAFTFAPGDTLRPADLRDTSARLAALGVFSRESLQLEALPDGERFDLRFEARERNGWGPNKWAALASTFRGVLFQTVQPQYDNWGGNAVNFTSMLRWDPQKRRIEAGLSAPLRSTKPYFRFSFGVDARDERWSLLRSDGANLGDLRLRRTALSAGIASFASASWQWSSTAELSHRDVDFAGALNGFQLKHTFRLRRDLLRIPSRRFESEAEFTSDTGRIWATGTTGMFERLEAGASLRWAPRMSGDDYAVQARVRTGRIFGQVPFDELFILGLERDNNLWMRAHIGTRDGRKGSAPLGRQYTLANFEFDKQIYRNGVVTVALSPFLDTGRITNGFLQTPNQWLWDTGLQTKVRAFGVGFTVAYGKDLRTGRNAFYATANLR